MTPRALRQALAARRASWPDDDLELLAAVEQQADAHPGEPGWTTLLLAAHLLHSAPTALPEGMVRDRLVRFDALSATWTAHAADGSRFLVRVPRPHLTPVELRLLARDLRALQPLIPGLRAAGHALVAPLEGEAVNGPRDEASAVRVVATTLVQLAAWSRRRFGPLAPAEEELRVVAGRARIVCLTPGPVQLAPWLHHLALTLRPGGLLGPVLRGLVELPPPDADEAAQRLAHALRDDLSARAVALRQRQLLSGHTRRRARLQHALGQLERALPPPKGRSPVGYDLDARPTAVWSDGRVVQWGAEQEPQQIWDGQQLDAPAARRLLRALATAPAQAPHAEHMGRWVAAGLRVRTMRMLLEKTTPASAP